MEWLSTYGNIAAAILVLFAGMVSTLLLGWLGYHRLRWRVGRIEEECKRLEDSIKWAKSEIRHVKQTHPSHDDLTASIARVEVSMKELRSNMNENVSKICQRMDRLFELMTNVQVLDRRRSG